MRHILSAAVIVLAMTASAAAQWGYQRPYLPRPYMPRPYIRAPYHQPSYSAQTMYLPNATFYQDSYGNSGMSVWSGNARFDTFNFGRPVPYNPYWGW